jgi:hypothetical protein
MPKFNVRVVAVLELLAEFTIEANSETQACRQADLIADRLKINWRETPVTVHGTRVMWSETDQTAEVDAVEEAEEEAVSL